MFRSIPSGARAVSTLNAAPLGQVLRPCLSARQVLDEEIAIVGVEWPMGAPDQAWLRTYTELSVTTAGIETLLAPHMGPAPAEAAARALTRLVGNEPEVSVCRRRGQRADDPKEVLHFILRSVPLREAQEELRTILEAVVGSDAGFCDWLEALPDDARLRLVGIGHAAGVPHVNLYHGPYQASAMDPALGANSTGSATLAGSVTLHLLRAIDNAAGQVTVAKAETPAPWKPATRSGPWVAYVSLAAGSDIALARTVLQVLDGPPEGLARRTADAQDRLEPVLAQHGWRLKHWTVQP